MLLDWLRNLRRSGVILVGLAALSAAPLFGQQSTGKVQGRVTDMTTGEPIAGAQVTVLNSTLGNLTNDQGYYFINGVPAGPQSFRVQFIGYRSVIVEDERILAGQTTTLSFTMEQTAVQLEAITVQGERNPLVPRDQVASKAIVKGETIDQLPLDNATSIVVLEPGVVQTNSGRTIRGGRPNEEAVFIDGLLVKGFGTGKAEDITVPTNALQQVDVTVGAFSAEFGEGQSGVVSFVTRRGGPKFTGSLEGQSDQFGPDQWRTNFNRLEATLGGPIAGPLTFFLAGTANGQTRFRNDGLPEIFAIDGVDTCPGDAQFASLCTAGQAATFEIPRSSSTPGATDLVKVTAPNFVPNDNGRTVPNNWSDQYLFTSNINYQLPRGSRITLGYTRNRNQTYGRGGITSGSSPVTVASEEFNTDRAVGSLNTQNVFSLSSFLVLKQSASSQLALDLRASYQNDRFKNGILDQQWWLSHHDQFGAFSIDDIEFATNEETFRPLGLNIFDPQDDFVNVVRSAAVPSDSLAIFGGRNDLSVSQSRTGLAGNLRDNPFGMETTFFDNGIGNSGLGTSKEDRWQFRATVDWQLGRFNRVKFGGDFNTIRLRQVQIPTFNGIVEPDKAQPKRAGGFFQDRLDLGDLVLEAGVRWDFLHTGIEFPRTPGFVSNVPDSLQAGFVRAVVDPATGATQFVPKFDTPCGGVSATNPNGTCLSNFIAGSNKSEFSPRLGASFPVTPTSTFRLSFGRFVQTPAFFAGQGTFSQSSQVEAAGQVGLLSALNGDLARGQNTNAIFTRDVDLPSTRTFEFGYRQLIGQDLVIDISAFNKKQRAGLSARKEQFADPTVPGKSLFINVIENADFTEANGFELKVDKTIGNIFSGNISYSFLDAKGTGSDPFTFTRLVLRGLSAFSFITGEPENPPELLLPLDQSRRHNISVITSVTIPRDFAQGTVLGAIFSNVGVFSILTVRSGLPLTKLLPQGNGQIGPPSAAGLGGSLQASLNNLATPWQSRFDIRVTKGLNFGGLEAQLFADVRNPFNINTVQRVFLETGNPVNALAKSQFLNTALTDPDLDGDNLIDDFDIVQESPENAFNKFMLLRAEQRFADDPNTPVVEQGDGVFTVAEQTRAFGQIFDLARGPKVLTNTNSQLRLGMRLSF